MKIKDNKAQSVQDDHMSAVRDIVAKVGALIDETPALKDMNFGLFYQHGRLGFIDLDAFAKSTKAKINIDGEEKSLTELQKDIDKNKE